MPDVVFYTAVGIIFAIFFVLIACLVIWFESKPGG